MPYTSEHKQETRARIIESARQLFNRRGFSEVSIDEIMAAAGLTRGGFYNHFRTKDELYAEALKVFACADPIGVWRDSETDFGDKESSLALQVVTAYLSHQHLRNIDYHCPLIALSSDVSREGPEVRQTYQRLFEGMARLFERHAPDKAEIDKRQQGLAIAATCIGAMVLARTIDDSSLSNEIRDAALTHLVKTTGWGTEP